MKYMATYDLMESARNTQEWLGASARAFASYPAFALSMNPFLPVMAAWGDLTERSFSRMITKPDWGIRSIVGPNGQDHLIDEQIVVEKPFGNLVHFFVRRRRPMARRAPTYWLAQAFSSLQDISRPSKMIAVCSGNLAAVASTRAEKQSLVVSGRGFNARASPGSTFASARVVATSLIRIIRSVAG